MFVVATGNKHILSFQTKYTLIDEQDIPLVENYAFEVQELKISLKCHVRYCCLWSQN